MAGEHILVIDDSAAIRSIAQCALENEGYRVTLAGNGVAALLAPDFDQYNLVIMDSRLEGLDGAQTARALKRDEAKSRTPVLLLIPEEDRASGVSADRGEVASPSAAGAAGWLLKPFEPALLVHKVRALLEEREVLEACRAQLKAAAERHVGQLCDGAVRAALEAKTQLLAERAIQAVVAQVDQQTRREVDARVTTLTAEKEQELVRQTVHEVARSMVDKLAERKVTDAIETNLKESTDQAVRRAADATLPGMMRERLRESMDALLPREVDLRVRQAAEQIVPGISEQIVGMVTSIGEKIVPKLARESLPELSQRHVSAVADKTLPRLVEELVAKFSRARMEEQIAQTVREATARIRRRAAWFAGALLALFLVFGATLTWLHFRSKAAAPPAVSVTAPGPTATQPRAR